MQYDSLQQQLDNTTDKQKIWDSSNLEKKRRLHKTLFPEGIFYNAQKHQDLTRNVNTFVELVASISALVKKKITGTFKILLKIPVLYRE